MENPWQGWSAEQARQWEYSHLEGVEGLRMRLKRAAQWDIIAGHLPANPSGRVLDLGAGTGVWSIRLAAEGCEVTLTDISEGMLARAREAVGAAGVAERVTIERVDMVDLARYPDRAFDLVLAIGAPLSYASDPARAAAEVFRVTRPGGAFIGDAENRYLGALFRRRAQTWADARRILLEGTGRWPDPENPAPIHMFHPDQVRDLLTAAGWRVQAMYASDVIESLVNDDIINEIAARPGLFGEVLAVEKQLRSEPYLLASGRDIQFVATRPAP